MLIKIFKRCFLFLFLFISLNYSFANENTHFMDKIMQNYEKNKTEEQLDIKKSNGNLEIKQNIIKVKTHFDFLKEKEMEEVIKKRNEILSSIKINGGTNFIDKELLNEKVYQTYSKIDKDKDGFYLIIDIEGGDILNVNNVLYYIYDYNITGNIELQTLIKNKILEKKDNTNEVLKILEKYNIKYYRLDNIEFNLYIQDQNQSQYKEKIKLDLFFNLEFPLPKISELYSNKEKFLWGYVGYNDLKSLGIELENLSNNIYIEFNGKIIYLGKYESQKIFETKMVEENGVINYNISKNNFVFIYIIVLFLIGIITGIIAFLNFIKKINLQIEVQPEDI